MPHPTGSSPAHYAGAGRRGQLPDREGAGLADTAEAVQAYGPYTDHLHDHRASSMAGIQRAVLRVGSTSLMRKEAGSGRSGWWGQAGCHPLEGTVVRCVSWSTRVGAGGGWNPAETEESTPEGQQLRKVLQKTPRLMRWQKFQRASKQVNVLAFLSLVQNAESLTLFIPLN